MDSYDHEPTEEEWAAIGRYLAGRMRATSVKMDGTSSYHFGGGWPALVGRSVPQAVMLAIEIEDEESEKKKDRKEKGGKS